MVRLPDGGEFVGCFANNSPQSKVSLSRRGAVHLKSLPTLLNCLISSLVKLQGQTLVVISVM
jgi:hypothetical protein